MCDGLTFTRELSRLISESEKAVDEMREAGAELASAEMKYRIALAAEIHYERRQGYAVSMIRETARGAKEVAEAMLRRDVARTNYEAAQENVNVKKLCAKLVGEQINRELGRPSNS